MQVLIRADRHANLDSLPLRFGIHYKEDQLIELHNCELLGQDNKHPNRYHYDAQIKRIGKNGLELCQGRFVLESKDGKPDELVTAWINDQDTEYYLSHLMTELRKNNQLTPKRLLELHPYYRSGKIRTSADLISILVEFKTKAEVASIQSIAQQAKIEAEENISKIGILTNQVEVLTKDNHLKEVKIMELQAENKRLEADKRAAQMDQKTLILAQPDVLVAVNTNVMHRGSSCTELVMGNNTRWYMKTITFDKDGRITQRAKSLIGKSVKISSWDPIDSPGYWSSQHYFRNIYLSN